MGVELFSFYNYIENTQTFLYLGNIILPRTKIFKNYIQATFEYLPKILVFIFKNIRKQYIFHIQRRIYKNIISLVPLTFEMCPHSFYCASIYFHNNYYVFFMHFQLSSKHFNFHKNTLI